MKNIFLSYKKPFSVVIALIIAGGLLAYTKLQTSLFPPITFPKIKIIADAGLQPVDKMMVSVTQPLENAIKQVPDLVDVRSITSRGSCEISAFINWNADVNLSLQQIQARVAQIRGDLPPGTVINAEKMNPSILPVLGYTLESTRPGFNAIDTRQLAQYTIKPFLSQVPGVAEVRIIGGKQKEFQVILDPSKMSRLSVTPDMVNTAMAQTNFIQSDGYLTDYRMMYLTVTDASVHSLDELKQVVLTANSNRAVLLEDVAEVKVNEAAEYTRINANGKEGLLIAIIQQPNANLVQLSAEMEKKVAELQKTLPSGVAVLPYYVQADFVNDSIGSVADSLWIGLALAIVVAILFLRSLKGSATILITIPVTVCLSLLVIYSIGYTINIMTLGAIAAAIGLIIDDAIVVTEQIQRTHEEDPEESSGTLVQRAIRYLFPAMLGSSISTIVIFVPFELMTGVAGAYFKVLANTMIITLACSFITTWLLLPVIYLLLSSKSNKRINAGKIVSHHVKPQRWVAYFIKRPVISVLVMVLFAVSIVLILPRLQTGFLPEMDEGSIVLDYTSPPGTSLEETDRMLREVEKIIAQVPEVDAYSRRTGTQMGFFITEPNYGDYLIQLKKKRGRSSDEVIAEIRSKIEASQPALVVDFGQVIGDMLGDLMESVQPIEIKIFGNNTAKLQELSREVEEVVNGVNGAADVFNGIVISGPSIRLQPNNVRLAQFGLTPAALEAQVQLQLQGTPAGSILESGRLSPLRLLYAKNGTPDMNTIRTMPVFLPSGKLSPMDQLAAVSITPGEAQIRRENLQSVGIVTARLDNRDLGSTMEEIRQKVNAQIHLPEGYQLEYGGAYAQQQRSFHELLLILIAASLLVFGVILFLFRHFSVALLILLIAVLGIAGSYWGLYLTGTPLNVGSYTGIIMIVGIIGENAIFTYLQFRESFCQTGNTEESIIYSISTRLRPKLMTALSAIIALLPLALGIGTGAKLHQPLAIAVIGGFLAALPLLLIVFPSMLKLTEKKRARDSKDGA